MVAEACYCFTNYGHTRCDMLLLHVAIHDLVEGGGIQGRHVQDAPKRRPRPSKSPPRHLRHAFKTPKDASKTPKKPSKPQESQCLDVASCSLAALGHMRPCNIGLGIRGNAPEAPKIPRPYWTSFGGLGGLLGILEASLGVAGRLGPLDNTW